MCVNNEKKKTSQTWGAETEFEQNWPFAAGCNFENSLDEKNKSILPGAARSLI